MKNPEIAKKRQGIILEIKRLFKIAGSYEKIIMDSKSTFSQKAAAAKSRNYLMRNILKLIRKL